MPVYRSFMNHLELLGESNILEADRAFKVLLVTEYSIHALQVYSDPPSGWTDDDKIEVGQTLCSYYLGLGEEKPVLNVPFHLLEGIKKALLVPKDGETTELTREAIDPALFKDVETYITNKIEAHYSHFLDSL